MATFVSFSRLKLGLLLLISASVVLFFAVLLWLSPTQPFRFNQSTLQVTKTGTVLQDGKRIATLGLNRQLLIPLITPKTTASAAALRIQLVFANSQARQLVTPRLLSLQGENGGQYIWNNATTLTVLSQPFAPDAYAVLQLSAPASFFQPSLIWYLQRAIYIIPFWVSAIVGLCILLLSIILMQLVIRPALWQNSLQSPIPPPELSPIQLAILHHSSIEPLDFVAFLVSLAEAGYLDIVEKSGDIYFLRTSKTGGLAPYEIGLLHILFPLPDEPSRLSNIATSLNKDLFSAVVSQLYIEMYNAFGNRQFFQENPRTAHIQYKTLGIMLQFSGLIVLLIAAFFSSQYLSLLPIGLGIYGSGYYVYKAARRVMLFTPEAKNYIEQCTQFVSYLSSADPIDASQSRQLYPYLSFALAAQVDQKWLARFANMPQPIPLWYLKADSPLSILNPSDFLEHVKAASQNLADVMIKVKDPNAD